MFQYPWVCSTLPGGCRGVCRHVVVEFSFSLPWNVLEACQATALLVVWTQQGKDVKSQYDMTLNQFSSMLVDR